MEQPWERISMSILAPLVHRLVIAITLLITGLRALPTNHCIRLGREERRRLTWEIKARRLLHDTDGELLLVAAARMVRNGIAERQVIVAHAEIHVIRIALRILQRHHQLVRIHMHLAELRTRHLIIKRQMRLLLLHEAHPLREVTIVSYKAQRTLIQHLLIIILHLIHRLSTFHIHIHFQSSVRTYHTRHLSTHTHRSQHRH